jgi:DNA replication protein DnaC
MTAAHERIKTQMLTANGLTSGIYGDMAFTTYHPRTGKQKAARARCEEVVKGWPASNYREGLMLYSPLSAVGVGKTHLAVSMARVACENLRSITVIGVNEYLDAIRDSFDKDRVTPTEQVRNRALAPDVLVFDDLGAEATGRLDWYKSQIYTVFDERWREGRATVVTTNLDVVQIAALIGERGASRLLAMTGPAVELDGPDLRLRSRNLRKGTE